MISKPRLLDSETAAKFLYAISLGLSKAGAARFCGVNPRTISGWLKQGKEETSCEEGGK